MSSVDRKLSERIVSWSLLPRESKLLQSLLIGKQWGKEQARHPIAPLIKRSNGKYSLIFAYSEIYVILMLDRNDKSVPRSYFGDNTHFFVEF